MPENEGQASMGQMTSASGLSFLGLPVRPLCLRVFVVCLVLVVGCARSEWVDAPGQHIEPLYNTETRERGLAVVDIGAIYHEPRALACFPERSAPDPCYALEGWVEAAVEVGWPTSSDVGDTMTAAR